jgi:serine-type D-Ala-D-Ala carboxypeptidase (penicillin-binding protein 5/6)
MKEGFMLRQWLAPITICAILQSSVSVASPIVRTQIADRVGSPYVGAITIDAATGKVLFEDKADAQGYPASVQKAMTLLVILDKVSQKTLNINESVPVTVEASKIGGSQVYLDPRETFPVDELLYALMVQSANDAAVALATHVAGSKDAFVELMNQKAKAIGMKNTTFHSVHGLPPTEGEGPDVTTARDLALLGRELVLKHPEALKYTSTIKRDFRNGTFTMENHDHLLKTFPGCDGLKTGYYKQAGYSILATATRNKTRVITVILGAAKGADPRHPNAGRDEMAAELINKGCAMLSSQKVAAK